ncbi:MAG: sulfatase [Candidatus Colwellbacteria bacterium]|nr:sulfatase [Candidatus Colwellbacteria bacterium]
MKKVVLGFLSVLAIGGYLIVNNYRQEISVSAQREVTAVPTDNICKDCNVVLITMTNLRYDHMSGNGYSRPTTPNVDKLSKESLVFQNAFGHSSWTLPEIISIYTSLFPFQHGVMNRYDGSTLSKYTPTLIDVLKDNGYTTAAFTGGFDYNTEFGLTNRFDHYEECTRGQGQNYPRQPGPRIGGPSQYGEVTCTVPKAIDWLKENSREKFFVQVQGFDAHCPFSQNGGLTYDKNYKGAVDFSDCLWTFDRTGPQIIDGQTYYKVYFSKTGTDKFVLLGEEDVKHLIALYDESITSADKEIGKLLNELKSLGIYDKTIIIFASEHGDMFGKYGRFMRGGPLRGTFYDDVLHIPLLIKSSQISPKRIDGLAEQIDILPTLLDLLGIQNRLPIEGKSLSPLIFQDKEVNEYIFAGSNFTPGANNQYYEKKTRVEVIRDKNWKLIKETVFEKDGTSKESLELYDISQDKEELHNVLDERADVVSDLKERLNNRFKADCFLPMFFRCSAR